MMLYYITCYQRHPAAAGSPAWLRGSGGMDGHAPTITITCIIMIATVISIVIIITITVAISTQETSAKETKAWCFF